MSDHVTERTDDGLFYHGQECIGGPCKCGVGVLRAQLQAAEAEAARWKALAEQAREAGRRACRACRLGLPFEPDWDGKLRHSCPDEATYRALGYSFAWRESDRHLVGCDTYNPQWHADFEQAQQDDRGSA